ncbi:MAG: HAMP domain-containing histidine kinase [Oscillospiraceae bacterium]|nr:HAMP domain-containing histidine kinase [Oscillospiraceae bacterium]
MRAGGIRSEKKIKIHRRILGTFTALLFVSFLITGVFANMALELVEAVETYDMALAQHIYGRANLVLFALIGVIFFIAVIATYFLSNSITRPIEKLDKFALNIGRGDFTPNNFVFREQELEDLNSALNESVRRLGIYDNEQKTFFQNASHELRTPLMSIKCHAEGIVFDVMDPKQAGETILQETDKLSDLVTDLLYIAKIDNITTAYTREPVNLTELIRGCASRQQALAEKNNLRIAFDFGEEEINLTCVQDLISRAIDNMLSNAIRYAKAEIVLSCHKYAGLIELSVKDDGEGIDAGTLPHVFERFYKGKGGHTGIGLSIVKSIAEQHSGKVRAENAQSGGARFVMTLPC